MVLGCRILVAVSLLATVVSTLRVYPHQLTYFNELSGGPENGCKHLLHSNLDWGQDLLFVREWMEREGIRRDEVQTILHGPLTIRAEQLVLAVTKPVDRLVGRLSRQTVRPSRMDLGASDSRLIRHNEYYRGDLRFIPD